MRRLPCNAYFLLSISFVLFLAGCAGEHGADAGEDFPVLTGEYFGQSPPGPEPVLFAPGIISTSLFTRDVAMTPEGDEIYFSSVLGMYVVTQILHTRYENGKWTEPEIAPFSGNPDYMDVEPAISPDGKRLFFLSSRPDSAAGVPAGSQDIWVVDRIGDGWSEPYNLGKPVNTEAPEFFPSVTNDGTLYFTRTTGGGSFIFRSRLMDGKYAEPEKLPEQVNSVRAQYNAFISPDESFLITCVAGREDCLGGDDYYISFRDEDDSWVGPINMGDKVNTDGGRQHSPYVSPDGKYFFFMSSRLRPEYDVSDGRMTRELMMEMQNNPGGGQAGIYWIDASFIEKLRP